MLRKCRYCSEKDRSHKCLICSKYELKRIGKHGLHRLDLSKLKKRRSTPKTPKFSQAPISDLSFRLSIMSL